MAYLAALGNSVRLLVFVRAHTEVLDSLARVPFASEEEGVGASRGTKSKLVKGQNLTACTNDASTSATSHTQRSKADGGNSRQANIIRNSSYNNNDRRLRGALRASEFLGDF